MLVVNYQESISTAAGSWASLCTQYCISLVMSGVACVLFLSFSVIDLTEDSQLAQEPVPNPPSPLQQVWLYHRVGRLFYVALAQIHVWQIQKREKPYHWYPSLCSRRSVVHSASRCLTKMWLNSMLLSVREVVGVKGSLPQVFSPVIKTNLQGWQLLDQGILMYTDVHWCTLMYTDVH